MYFELSEQMVMIIIDALGEYKFKLAAPVISELQQQIRVQRSSLTNGKTDAQPDRTAPSA